jgi:hypothetical protein
MYLYDAAPAENKQNRFAKLLTSTFHQSNSGFSSSFLETLLQSEKRVIGVAIFDVPFSSCCVSTTNPVIDAGIIALERYLSLF